MNGSATVAACLLAIILATAPVGAQPAIDRATDHTAALELELRAVETAFAQTMADRDFEAFTSFLAEETVFFGGSGALRGRLVVARQWRSFFESDAAPFAWAPEHVAVLESGHLGLSTGPIFDARGNRVGTFNSVWRRLDDGTWEIIFDKGCPECE